MEGKIYESVGIECGTLPHGQEVVGLMFPTGIGEECEMRYLTLPCAKALLIDMKDGIAACLNHANK